MKKGRISSHTHKIQVLMWLRGALRGFPHSVPVSTLKGQIQARWKLLHSVIKCGIFFFFSKITGIWFTLTYIINSHDFRFMTDESTVPPVTFWFPEKRFEGGVHTAVQIFIWYFLEAALLLLCVICHLWPLAPHNLLQNGVWRQVSQTAVWMKLSVPERVKQHPLLIFFLRLLCGVRLSYIQWKSVFQKECFFIVILYSLLLTDDFQMKRM